MESEMKGDFGIVIAFGKDTPRPKRIFDSMSELITALEGFDKALVSSIEPSVSMEILLSEIEPGSLKVWLKSKLEAIEDKDLKNLDWKLMLGKFLVMCKYKLIKFLSDKKTIKKIDEIKLLQKEIEDLAISTQTSKIPAYQKIPTSTLLYDINHISEALTTLDPADTVTYITPENSIQFNKDFSITDIEIEDLIVQQKETQESDLVMRIKKPDYLGQSMWEMQLDGHPIQVKIIDEDWLEEFHGRKIDLRPGDSLKAHTRIVLRLDEQGNKLPPLYTILKVIKVIASDEQSNLEFFFGEETKK